LIDEQGTASIKFRATIGYEAQNVTHNEQLTRDPQPSKQQAVQQSESS